jgi:hypothetical protein
MGHATFLFPSATNTDAVRELERAFMAGGPDGMPWPTRARLQDGTLKVSRHIDESGFLAVPWDIPQTGRLMCASATIMDREQPYHLPIELARGKVNQVRCQAEDWRSGGLTLSPELSGNIRDASLAFGHAILQPAGVETDLLAQKSLLQSFRTAHQLVQAYVDQVFQVRHERDSRLETTLGCRLEAIPTSGPQFQDVFSTVGIPLRWREIQPQDGVYHWERYDALFDWALANQLAVTGGPVIDFSPAQIPEWLGMWERDPGSLARFATEYVTAVLKRYRNRIRRWHLVAAANNASVLALKDEELLWLTIKVAQTARQLDPELESMIGVAQPWGEYMAMEERSHSPFLFADTLIRTDVNLSALDIELVMGVTPRGSYCRDLLDTSRLLDLYALLGVPLRVTMGYPSATSLDPRADRELVVGGGHWHGPVALEGQTEWAGAFATLALCKPYVQGIQWSHWSDEGPHQFPNCGLVDASGTPKPAIEKLRHLRTAHLK